MTVKDIQQECVNKSRIIHLQSNVCLPDVLVHISATLWHDIRETHQSLWKLQHTHTQINIFTLLPAHIHTSSPATYQTNFLLRSQAQLHQNSEHTHAPLCLSCLLIKGKDDRQMKREQVSSESLSSIMCECVLSVWSLCNCMSSSTWLVDRFHLLRTRLPHTGLKTHR